MCGLSPLTRYSVRSNLTLDSVEDAISELKLYKAAGGSTVCDVTCVGIRLADFRPKDLQRISRETGVNILVGTGFYVDSFVTEETTHEHSGGEAKQRFLGICGQQ